MNNQTTKCALAYHGLSINQDGTLDPCCQYWHHNNSKKIQFTEFSKYQDILLQSMYDDFDAGRKHIGCEKCYLDEVAGKSSLRIESNKKFPEYNNEIYDVELRLGNLCNLKCIMCSPVASSSISAERYQNVEKFKMIGLYSQPNPENYWESEEFDSFIQKTLSKVKHINITGGEPFMIPEVVNILDYLLLNKDTVQISFNTNLTVLTEKILARLQKFKNLEIMISLEGIKEMNEYLRYPSCWDTINSNIEILKQKVPMAVLSINHTLQHASAYSLPALAKFCADKKLTLHLTTIQGWPYMTLDSVPEKDLITFQEWTDQTDSIAFHNRVFLKTFIKQAQFNLDNYLKFRAYIKLLDEIRKTSYDQIFNPSLPIALQKFY